MPLLINLRHLQKEPMVLKGELPPKELDLAGIDELIQAPFALKHSLEAQELDGGVLVQGQLHLNLRCECVRCLKVFIFEVDFPSWAGHLPLSGEDAAVVKDDCVDLTPLIREDILLAFPQHPLCEPDCRGLPQKPPVGSKKSKGASQSVETSSAWAELNKLKFEKK